ncbi:unnamed protein product [Thelazia callipaeda]|uniref:GYF domain-containing protein n=1 Tax=Thelazia callipaeda TaxID=103827 RepID=A0A0N5CZX2_THECL|nr:unnamed protein product [Thelazia callipaeda]
MDPVRDGLNIPKWFYQGEDHRVYGPYSSAEMQKWYKTGYFVSSMLLRTKNDDRFHTLAEWSRYSSGQSPFLIFVNSFDQLVNFSLQAQMSRLIITPTRVPATNGPYFVVPQTAPASTPTPVHGFAPAPGFLTYQQNSLMIAPQIPSFGPLPGLSQPPSEPLDELPSTISNTPDDSDTNWNIGLVQNVVPLPFQEKSTDTYDASWNLARDIGTDPEYAKYRDVSTQTNPGRISAEQAVRLLSEIIGIQLEIEG